MTPQCLIEGYRISEMYSASIFKALSNLKGDIFVCSYHDTKPNTRNYTSYYIWQQVIIPYIRPWRPNGKCLPSVCKLHADFVYGFVMEWVDNLHSYCLNCILSSWVHITVILITHPQIYKTYRESNYKDKIKENNSMLESATVCQTGTKFWSLCRQEQAGGSLVQMASK